MNVSIFIMRKMKYLNMNINLFFKFEPLVFMVILKNNNRRSKKQLQILCLHITHHQLFKGFLNHIFSILSGICSYKYSEFSIIFNKKNEYMNLI